MEAARVYERAGKLHEQSAALTYLAQAYQSIGQYKQALKSLELALAVVKKSGDRRAWPLSWAALAMCTLPPGPVEVAHWYLNEGLGMAQELGDAALEAVILNNLGNLFTSQKQYTEALRCLYQQCEARDGTGNQSLAVRALINAVKASRQRGQHQEAKTLLDKALNQIRGLDQSHDKAYGLISIGLAYHDLHSHLPDSNDSLFRLAAKMFDEAATVAEIIGDRRAASYAWGYLGALRT